jgi:hypothetical protein
VSIKDLLDDQTAFNRQIWNPEGKTEAQRMQRIKDLVEGIHEEACEFLRTFEHKAHRRYKGRSPNIGHSHEELTDILKYWLSLADMVGLDSDRVKELYMEKSRVVRYRFQDEWLSEIDKPCVIVDIDQVLADYIAGICDWAEAHTQRLLGWGQTRTGELRAQLAALRRSHCWVDYRTVGVTYNEWQIVKHDIRVRGGKKDLPVFPDAREFLLGCKRRGYLVVLITSRPIDRYPNIFTDTITWLYNNHLPFDYLWWADRKADRMEEGRIKDHTVFAVDDSMEFVQQFRNRGIKSYWLDRGRNSLPQDAYHIKSLTELLTLENLKDGNT